MDLAIKHGHVYLGEGFKQTNVYVKDGRIARISDRTLDAAEAYDAEGALVLPGLIDPHVHFLLEIGGLSTADDFESGSRAAIHGGVTTVIDFLEPARDSAELQKNFDAAREQIGTSYVDYRLHATVKNPVDADAFVDTAESLGLDSIKLFTTYSDSGRRTYDAQIRRLLERSVDGPLVLAHIEDDEQIILDESFTHEHLPQSRPSSSETDEALKLAGFVQETGGRLYMVHLSSGETLRRLLDAYRPLIGKHFLVESCPQYFSFNAEKLRGETGRLFSFAPPLRSETERRVLHEHAAHINTIGTDHAPFTSEQKQADRLSKLPLGIGGVEHAFDVMYYHLGESAINKMSRNVAHAFGLYPRKGVIAEGSDADIMVYRLGERTIQENHSAADYSAYTNHPARGSVESTILRGRFVLKDGRFIPVEGRYLQKE